jgi:hypothetical protein
MTPGLTLLGRRAEDKAGSLDKPGDKKLLHTLDHAHLLGLYSVIRLFGEIREAEDPSVRLEIVAEAETRLAAFVSGLKPSSADRIGSTGFRSE